MNLIYKKTYKQVTKRLSDNNKLWEFIYNFIKEFNYLINEIDIKSDENVKRFKIIFSHVLPTRFVQIDFDVTKGILNYKLSECEDSEIAYKREVKFILQY